MTFNEVNYLVEASPKMFVQEKHKLEATEELFCGKFGFTDSQFKNLLLTDPSIVNMNEEKILEIKAYFAEKGMTDEEFNHVISEVPLTLQQNIERQVNEIFFYFRTYYTIDDRAVI